MSSALVRKEGSGPTHRARGAKDDDIVKLCRRHLRGIESLIALDGYSSSIRQNRAVIVEILESVQDNNREMRQVFIPSI